MRRTLHQTQKRENIWYQQCNTQSIDFPEELIHGESIIKIQDITNNAKNISTGTADKPNDPPSNSSAKKQESPIKLETTAPRKVSSLEKYSRTSSLRRDGSLTRAHSLETPLGVVKQGSSSAIDSLRRPGGSSQESFWRITTSKTNTPPILEEDDSKGKHLENTSGGKSKAKDKSKIKTSQLKRSMAFSEELIEISLDDNSETVPAIEPPALQEPPKEQQRNGKFQRFANSMKKMFPCTCSCKRKLDADKLLDINACSTENNK